MPCGQVPPHSAATHVAVPPPAGAWHGVQDFPQFSGSLSCTHNCAHMCCFSGQVGVSTSRAASTLPLSDATSTARSGWESPMGRSVVPPSAVKVRGLEHANELLSENPSAIAIRRRFIVDAYNPLASRFAQTFLARKNGATAPGQGLTSFVKVWRVAGLSRDLTREKYAVTSRRSGVGGRRPSFSAGCADAREIAQSGRDSAFTRTLETGWGRLRILPCQPDGAPRQ